MNRSVIFDIQLRSIHFRTFSPEALERHSKVCQSLHYQPKFKPKRGTFDTSSQRKKNTPIEWFTPPPTSIEHAEDAEGGGFSRNSRSRRSLRGTSCTSGILQRSLSSSTTVTPVTSTPQVPWRRARSQSQKPSSRHNSISNEMFDDNSEFGSNSDDGSQAPSQMTNSIREVDTSLPSYARPLEAKDECPYCRRCFGYKAYDRHVQFCKDVFMRKQYELQPTPKEKEEALERQEIRTKYRPIKGSTSCTSLRSMSPGKELTNMAMKFFGGLRRGDAMTKSYYSNNSNLALNNVKNNLIKNSNESLAASCYGDYARGSFRNSPARSSITQHSPSSVNTNNKINNLMSKQQQQHGGSYQYKTSLLPMRINTTSNILAKTKSTDNLAAIGNPYSHVSGSGYGQSSNFSRNSKTRSSLHKNFFRSSGKRVDPEGVENTSSLSTNGHSSPTSLIITPMSFFNKTKMSESQQSYTPTRSSLTTPILRSRSEIQNDAIEHVRRQKGSGVSTSEYDPYEMAAKQLQELLKTQPIINKNSSKRTQRKVGLDRALNSVLGSGDDDSNNASEKGIENHKKLKDKSTMQDFMGVGSQMPGVNINDSYWDQILHNTTTKTNNANNIGRKKSHLLANDDTYHSSGSETTTKSRAMSNVSSADSAFSRSDDLEFERLESLMSVGEVPSKGNAMRNKSFTSSTSLSKLLFSPQNSKDRDGTEPESPMDVSSPPPSLFSSHNSSQKDSASSLARFCHDCGTSYPSSLAKFCTECGQRRAVNI